MFIVSEEYVLSTNNTYESKCMFEKNIQNHHISLFKYLQCKTGFYIKCSIWSLKYLLILSLSHLNKHFESNNLKPGSISPKLICYHFIDMTIFLVIQLIYIVYIYLHHFVFLKPWITVWVNIFAADDFKCTFQNFHATIFIKLLIILA